MAYLIFSTDGLEWDRKELAGPMVIGRSVDCQMSIHDISLSRRHCRLTPTEVGWLLIDLRSRNGTLVGDRSIQERQLKNGDVIRVGKTSVTFRTEAFVPPRQPAKRPALPPLVNRVDDTMAGTVVGMEFDLPTAPIRPLGQSRRPAPKPRPKDPESFETDDLYSMLEQIASSSWDSIYSLHAQPLRRTRLMPKPMVAGQARLPTSRPQVSMALQAGLVAGAASIQMDLPVAIMHGARVVHQPSNRLDAAHSRRRLARFSRWILRARTMRLC